MKMFFATFLFIQFGFVVFWQKNIGAKAAHKMLMKLTKGLLQETNRSAQQSHHTSSRLSD